MQGALDNLARNALVRAAELGRGSMKQDKEPRMPNVNGMTLAMAIQAVDFKIADIERAIAALPEDEGADLESLLLSYDKAAQALKRAYDEARAEADNLPPYEKLVRG
jgi:hypothetical protein